MSAGFAQDLATGFSCLEAARHKAALFAFKKAAIAAPREMIALYGVGFAALRCADFSVAVAILSRAAIAARADTSMRVVVETQIALGHCLRSSGQSGQAIRSFRRAALIEPENALIQACYASCLEGEARLVPAAWAKVTEPGSPDRWNQLGLACSEAGYIGRADAAYRAALVLDPGHQHGWNNLAILDKWRDFPRRAIERFNRARLVRPDDHEVLLNLGRNLLLVGDFTRGWEYLEAPWRARGLQPRDSAFFLPVWNGEALTGGRLLLWSEEKIGEEIMFSTLLEDVARRAKTPITLLCDPRLVGLHKPLSPDIRIDGWPRGSLPPIRVDEHAACYPLEFVGRFVRRSFSDFPPTRPVLESGFAPKREKNGDPRVGVHWRSINPLVGAQKSTSLTAWGPILSVPGVTFVSLQYGSVAEDLRQAHRNIGVAPVVPDGIDQLVDMRGFAELVAGLDLVISVSSTSAHVAAALGVPTWVVLPRGPGLSWFWFENRRESPWYPNCTLYRQDVVGRWAPVIERVGRDLAIWRENHETRSGWITPRH